MVSKRTSGAAKNPATPSCNSRPDVSFLHGKRRVVKVPKVAVGDPELLLLYFCRSKFVHPVITHYTAKKLSKLTGRSENTIRKYVRRWIRHGLAEFRGPHLHLKKFNPPEGEKKDITEVSILPWTKYNTFKVRVYVAHVSRHMAQQNYAYSVKKHHHQKNNMDSFVSKKLLKEYNKRYALVDGEAIFSSDTFVSSRSIARSLFINQTEANNLLREAQKMGFLDRKMRVSEVTPIEFKYADGYKFEVRVKRSRLQTEEASRFFVHRGIKIYLNRNFLYFSSKRDSILSKIEKREKESISTQVQATANKLQFSNHKD